jgi:hypothetical protein
VNVDYSKLSAHELEESIGNVQLPKAVYAFVQDTPDTGFLNYFNNPAYSALNAKTMGPLDASTILANDRSSGGAAEVSISSADQQLANRIDALYAFSLSSFPFIFFCFFFFNFNIFIRLRLFCLSIYFMYLDFYFHVARVKMNFFAM